MKPRTAKQWLELWRRRARRKQRALERRARILRAIAVECGA